MNNGNGEPKAWRCIVCGYNHTGDSPPDICPICGVGPEEFKPYKEMLAGIDAGAVVLDVMLPGVSGFEVCESLREELPRLPILMLTVRREDPVKVAGLELGADDYLTKPFNPKELVARVKAILRRTDGIHRSGVDVTVGSLHLNRQRREAELSGKSLKLRTKAFDLLFALAQNLHTVMSREQLLSLVWGYTFSGETRTVDVHINHLRQHLKGSDLAIETLRGVGYKLTVQDVSESGSALTMSAAGESGVRSGQ